MISHLARTVQFAVLATVPQGGQRSARRNAWAAMSQNAVTARARRDAAGAMDRAVDRATTGAGHLAATAR